ncbi:MAG: prolyl oligopeptidase family serine peptidase, partial [Ferruginibacter sp.]
SRQTYINNFTLKNIQTGQQYPISGLPVNMLAGNIVWSDNEQKIAFTNTVSSRVDAYVINVKTRNATRINKRPLNVTNGAGLAWLDDNSILYKVIPAGTGTAPKKSVTPKGPAVQESTGKASPGRTNQDMISSLYDEQLFQYMATAQLVMNRNGIEKPIGRPVIYPFFSLSPDKKYLMWRHLSKPFSYSVPAGGFPATLSITDLNGKLLKTIAELPSAETIPSGNDNVQNVPRGFSWRSDEPATLIWARPLDSGLIAKKMEFHDAVYALAAPFTAEPKKLFETNMRYRGVIWGNQNFAWVTQSSIGKQTVKVSRYDPSKNTMEALTERSFLNAYADPGIPVTVKNKFNRDVIYTKGNTILMNNQTGSSPNGDLPFLASFDYDTKKTELLWRAAEGSFENVVSVIDPENLVLLTRRESQKDVPNYFLKNLKLKKADQAITAFTNPYPELAGVSKTKIKYKRADGVDLTGDLYLPEGYNKEKDGPLPVLIWAYPREFNNAADAAQIRGSNDRFTGLSWGSPVFYVTQGFAVLDNAEMPIVSKDTSKKPNDSFVEQLKMNAAAAIDHLSSMGVGDKNRVAVGGHSYGAFMTANLLSHTSLFKAGIARSGAYNRTLTPFGFQGEDRTYWQAPDLYYAMSPFSYADKIKAPLLLIHGDTDDNQGTFPINSERLYTAIKGHGGKVRLVMLPYEAHGYRGKENILHMLWEQNEWLRKYVK